MKRAVYMILFILCTLGVSAQKTLFLFIRQSSGQPFYVRMGEQNHSSSAGGHIILGGLQDSVYTLYIGFPKSTAPEWLFRVSMHQDRGFDLQPAGNGWRLTDQQSGEAIIAAAVGKTGGEAMGTRRTDAYSTLMAGVVNDSSVLYTDAATRAVEEKKAAATSGNVAAKEAPSPAAAGAPVAAVPKRVPDSAGLSGHPVPQPLAAGGEMPEAAAADTAGRGDSGAVARVAVEAKKLDDTLRAVKRTGAATGGPRLRPQVSAAALHKRAGADTAVRVTPAAGLPAVASAAKDSTAGRPASGAAGSPAPQTAVPVAKNRPGDVVRYGTENLAEGKAMIFIDRSMPVTDTIRLLIPRL